MGCVSDSMNGLETATKGAENWGYTLTKATVENCSDGSEEEKQKVSFGCLDPPQQKESSRSKPQTELRSASQRRPPVKVCSNCCGPFSMKGGSTL